MGNSGIDRCLLTKADPLRLDMQTRRSLLFFDDCFMGVALSCGWCDRPEDSTTLLLLQLLIRANIFS